MKFKENLICKPSRRFKYIWISYGNRMSNKPTDGVNICLQLCANILILFEKLLSTNKATACGSNANTFTFSSCLLLAVFSGLLLLLLNVIVRTFVMVVGSSFVTRVWLASASGHDEASFPATTVTFPKEEAMRRKPGLGTER